MNLQEKRAGRLRIIVFIIVTALILAGIKVYEDNKNKVLEQRTVIVHAEALPEPTVVSEPPVEVIAQPEPSVEVVEDIVEEIVAPVSVSPPPVSNQNGRCGDNDYAHAIYMGESSCRMDIINSIGACGLGQSLPCEKMANDCPNWRTDYDCQNRWFTAYAMQYGSWENAYNFKFCTGYCYSTRTKTTVFKPVDNPWW